MYPLGALKHFFIGLEKVELDEGALSMFLYVPYKSLIYRRD